MAIFNGSAEDIQSKQNMLSNLEAEEGADKYPSVLGVKMYVADKIQEEREYNQQTLDGKENISNRLDDLTSEEGADKYPSVLGVKRYVTHRIEEAGGSAQVDTDLFANALKSNASGEVIHINDISPIEHTVKAKVRSKNLLNADGMVNTSFVKNDDGSFTFTKSSSSRFSNLADISIPANTYFSISATNIEGTASGFAFQFKCKDGNYSTAGPFSPANLTFYAFIPSEIEAVRVFFDSSAADGAYLNISGLQIELGGVTEYVPYVDVSTVSVVVSSDEVGASATEYTPDADGVVEGIKSLYPSMVITTDADGANIDVTYNADTKKYIDNKFAELQAAIISLGGNV